MIELKELHPLVGASLLYMLIDPAAGAAADEVMDMFEAFLREPRNAEKLDKTFSMTMSHKQMLVAATLCKLGMDAYQQLIPELTAKAP